MNESRCDVHKVDNEAEDVNNSYSYPFLVLIFQLSTLDLSIWHFHIDI